MDKAFEYFTHVDWVLKNLVVGGGRHPQPLGYKMNHSVVQILMNAAHSGKIWKVG